MSYKGVKKFITHFKEPFDAETVSFNVAKKRLREKGISTASKLGQERIKEEQTVVLAEWQKSADDGTAAHELVQNREMELHPNSIMGGWVPTEEGVLFNAEEINHTDRDINYFEKHVVDNDLMIRGFIDKCYVDKKGYIHITDYKTFKVMTRGYTFEKNGIRFQKLFFAPIAHVVDCKFSEANLQCSIYMYLIWKHNPKLKPGTITIHHVILDDDGKPTGEEVPYDAPYMVEEVKAMAREYKKQMNNEVSI